MMKSSREEAAGPGNGHRRGTRKSLIKFTDNDKENVDIYGGGSVGLNDRKSPLPVGFPRLPLQDITAVLLPLNDNSDDEEPSTGMRKPFTRSRGSRKMGNVQKTVLSERTSKNATRAGPSKTRKKQVTKIVVDKEIKPVIQTGHTGQLKEAIHLTLSRSNSVHFSAQTMEGQKTEAVPSTGGTAPVTITEVANANGSARSVAMMDKENVVETKECNEATVTEEENRATLEKPKESSVPSSSGTRNEFSQDQKRRKPLSARSSVSSFR